MCLLLTGAEVEGSAIPKVVSIEGVVPETQEAAKAATEPAEEASQGAPGVVEEKRNEVLPDSSLEVVVRSPEIQDAEPIRLVPMSGTATTSRGGIELLANDLVDPAAVARNLEAMRRAEQWMKVSYQYPWMVNGDTVLWAEALEEELAKARKHSAMLQSKLDGAFAQYHNEVQDMQVKSDELVRKNKSLRNKNKGTLLSCRVPIGSTLQ
jgi:FtsZ-binding cell division protein ZapB